MSALDDSSDFTENILPRGFEDIVNDLPDLDDVDPSFEDGELLPDDGRHKEALISFCGRNIIVKFGEEDSVSYVKERFIETIGLMREFWQYAQKSESLIFQMFSSKFNEWIDVVGDGPVEDGQKLRALVKSENNTTGGDMQLEMCGTISCSSEGSDNKISKHKDRGKKGRKRHRKMVVTRTIRKHKKKCKKERKDHRASSPEKGNSSSSSSSSVLPYTSERDETPGTSAVLSYDSTSHYDSTSQFNSDVLDVYQYEEEYRYEETYSEYDSSYGMGPSQAGVFNAFLDIRGKNPIMALNELCTRMKWEFPSFQLANEVGMPHEKMFRMQVTVKGVTYMTDRFYKTKKEAKAKVAKLALNCLGFL